MAPRQLMTPALEGGSISASEVFRSRLYRSGGRFAAIQGFIVLSCFCGVTSSSKVTPERSAVMAVPRATGHGKRILWQVAHGGPASDLFLPFCHRSSLDIEGSFPRVVAANIFQGCRTAVPGACVFANKGRTRGAEPAGIIDSRGEERGIRLQWETSFPEP